MKVTSSFWLMIPLACAASLLVGSTVAGVRVQTYTYKRVGDLEIKADIYRADDEKVRPVVVWIHGGALIDGRLFCSRDAQALDRIVDSTNKAPKTSGRIRDVMQVPLNDSILWAGTTSDVCGLAVGADGLVVLHHDSAEGVSIDGRSLWTAQLPATPVRWGAALTGKECVVTLSDGIVICLVNDSEK